MRAVAMVSATMVLAWMWGCGGNGEEPAEKAGKFLAEQQAKFAKGFGEGLEQEGEGAGKSVTKGGEKVLAGAGEGLTEDGEETGAKVAEGVGNVLKGIVKGLDKALTVTVEPGEGVGGSGVSIVRTDQNVTDDSRMEVNVYVTLSKAFDGKLALDLLDEKNVKLGSAETGVKGAQGETVKATFSFDNGSRVGFPGIRHVLRKP
jgi:hypothetical protein